MIFFIFLKMSDITFYTTNFDSIFELNPEIITLLEQDGYNNIQKLGEGASNLALLGEKNAKFYVLLLDKNIDEYENIPISEGFDLILKMQKNKKLNNNIVKLQKILFIENTKLSLDENYNPDIGEIHIPVYIEEYIEGISLNEHIFNMSKQDIDTKVRFFNELKNQMSELLEYIKSKNLYYQDLNTTNFILRDSSDISTLTFIDVDSFQDRQKYLRKNKIDSDRLDNKILRNLGLDFYGPILTPIPEEESNLQNVSELTTQAGLFKEAYQIGEIFGMIAANYMPPIKE